MALGSDYSKTNYFEALGACEEFVILISWVWEKFNQPQKNWVLFVLEPATLLGAYKPGSRGPWIVQPGWDMLKTNQLLWLISTKKAKVVFCSFAARKVFPLIPTIYNLNKYTRVRLFSYSQIRTFCKVLLRTPIENFSKRHKTDSMAKPIETAKARDKVQPSHLWQPLKLWWKIWYQQWHEDSP